VLYPSTCRGSKIKRSDFAELNPPALEVTSLPIKAIKIDRAFIDGLREIIDMCGDDRDVP